MGTQREKEPNDRMCRFRLETAWADLHIPPTPQEQVSWKGSLADPNVAAGYRDPQLIEQAAPLLAVLVVARSETNSTSIGFASRAGVVLS